jgi:hypothetical protein
MQDFQFSKINKIYGVCAPQQHEDLLINETQVPL